MNKQELIKQFEDMPYVSIHQMGKKSFIDMIEQLDEPQKPVVPQFVADWIKKCKIFEHLISLSFALNPASWEENRLSDECIDWLRSTSNQEVFARAWLFGYEVEKEPKYSVKVKGAGNMSFLNHDLQSDSWSINNGDNGKFFKTHHTRKELEDADFGWCLIVRGLRLRRWNDE